MREKTVESRLVKAVQCMGGLCPKWVSPGLDGVPDRIAILPGGQVWFIELKKDGEAPTKIQVPPSAPGSHGRIAFAELKAPGKAPRPLQLVRKRQLEALGFPVYIIDNIEQIGGVLDEISAT